MPIYKCMDFVIGCVIKTTSYLNLISFCVPRASFKKYIPCASYWSRKLLFTNQLVSEIKSGLIPLNPIIQVIDIQENPSISFDISYLTSPDYFSHSTFRPAKIFSCLFDTVKALFWSISFGL